ncbi:MAG: alkaline phosphatase family protein [Ardenticatenaceae bacterium]
MQHQKVMVIGLDGATFDLMKPWIATGKLPNLAQVIFNGSYGDLTSVTPPESPLAWPSFATGKNPGKHGVFGFYEPHPNKEYSLSPINARSNRAKTLYKILGEAGKNVISLAVPFTFPPEQIENGIVIPGEFCLPGESNNVLGSYPAEMQQEICDYLADPRLGVDTSLIYKSQPAFIEDLYTTTDNLLDAASYLLNNKAWDFFMLVFSGVDQVEHYFYRNYIDGDRFCDVILQYYQKVDEAIGGILAQIYEDETTLFVMSDHGMQPFNEYFCLNLWLQEQGSLVFKQPKRRFLKQKAIKALNKFGLKKILLDKFNFRWFSKGAVSNALSFTDVDFGKSKAYAYGFGSIRINLKGRDPEGVVDPAEYEEVREEIISALLAERDDQSGQPVLNAYKREEIYSGPFLEQAPDIIVTSDQYWPNGLAGVGPFSNLYGSKIEHSPFINGMHAMNGIFMAKGPHVRGSYAIDDANLIDLAPTILYSMGLPIPNDMDGKVLRDIFAPHFLAQHPPHYVKADAHCASERYEWSLNEEEALISRLQDLGYLA